MSTVFGLAGIAFVLAGVVLVTIARRYKTPDAPPIPSFNPKHWVQLWKIGEWYDPKGAKLYLHFIHGVAHRYRLDARLVRISSVVVPQRLCQVTLPTPSGARTDTTE